jgi:peptidoglycan/xylan/chitin deacetylase (PgdA/CDA1 family)
MSRLSEQAHKPIILMYHRVADPVFDPWGLAVAPHRFEEHLAVLREVRVPLAMTEFVDRLEQGILPNRAVGVTFDDGYVDNLVAAKPRLERAGIPASVFITTGNVGRAREFWWDELARLILGHWQDLDCEITLAGERFRLTLLTPSKSDLSLPRWEDWQRPRTEREFAYLEIWKRLRPLPGSECEVGMSNVRAAFGESPGEESNLPMTTEQIEELAAGGLIELGAHTVTHPALTALCREDRQREVAGSKSDCERLAGVPINGFSYPHGDFNDETRALVRESGFRFACAARGRCVEADRFDRFSLPRLPVTNWDAEAFERALLAVDIE